MDAHDCCELDHLEDFRFRGAGFQRVLNMATHAGTVKMGGGGVYRDKDHFLEFLFQRALQRHRAEMQKGLQIIRVQFLEQIPSRVPVAGGHLGFHMRIGLRLIHRSSSSVFKTVAPE